MSGFGAERRWVERQLAALGIRPQRAAGQHFLLDHSVVADAVAAAGLSRTTTVLEIGPGLGVLTEALLAVAGRVIAVEVERRFVAHLTRAFSGQPAFQIKRANLFDVDLNELVGDFQYVVVANLPYSITGLALRNFLTVPPRPVRLVLLLQREVAERIAASPGALSILGVMVQATATVTRLKEVPPESFWPEPAVASTLVKLELFPEPLDVRLGIAADRFFRVVRMGFTGRRKQLKNSLAAGLGVPPDELEPLLAECGVARTARAQELPVETWREMARKIAMKYFDRSEKK